MTRSSSTTARASWSWRVPKGWLPDPDSDYGSFHLGCATTLDMRRAVAEQQQTIRHLFGEFDPPDADHEADLD